MDGVAPNAVCGPLHFARMVHSSGSRQAFGSAPERPARRRANQRTGWAHPIDWRSSLDPRPSSAWTGSAFRVQSSGFRVRSSMFGVSGFSSEQSSEVDGVAPNAVSGPLHFARMVHSSGSRQAFGSAPERHSPGFRSATPCRNPWRVAPGRCRTLRVHSPAASPPPIRSKAIAASACSHAPKERVLPVHRRCGPMRS